MGVKLWRERIGRSSPRRRAEMPGWVFVVVMRR
jgi:hypothetical protein